MGQSAGAHISACTLIEQASKEAGGEGESVSWSVSQIKAYFGLSGGYVFHCCLLRCFSFFLVQTFRPLFAYFEHI